MILSVAAVGIIFGTVGLVAEAILAEVASGRREAKRMEQAVAELRDHFIVCGYGRVGSMVARELVHGGQRVVVVDIRPESLDTALADGHLVVAGDGTSDAVLLRAGVERARGLVTSIDSDANNVYVTLSARALNPGLFIVGRASADGAEAKVLQAGANRVVSPYPMAGRRIAELAIRPRVVEFIDAALSHGELAFSMEEVEVGAGRPLDGRDGRCAPRRRDLHPGDRPRPGRLRAEPSRRSDPRRRRDSDRLRVEPRRSAPCASGSDASRRRRVRGGVGRRVGPGVSPRSPARSPAAPRSPARRSGRARRSGGAACR